MRSRFIIIAVAIFSWFGSGLVIQGQASTHSCLITTAYVEEQEQLPQGLLYAIALTESGRWDPSGFSHAWPWTIRAAKDAFVVGTAPEAIEIVRSLKNQGRQNIDVGCMQVNLKYHPDAFPDLPTAFDPLANVTYAAKFLKSLRAEARSWQQAIQWYHSRNAEQGRPYQKKVYKHWRQAQIEVNKAHKALRSFRSSQKSEFQDFAVTKDLMLASLGTPIRDSAKRGSLAASLVSNTDDFVVHRPTSDQPAERQRLMAIDKIDADRAIFSNRDIDRRGPLIFRPAEPLRQRLGTFSVHGTKSN